MCEFSGRLIAWMDGEASAHEAGELARHLAGCAECQTCLAEFRRASRQWEEYGEAVLAESARLAGKSRGGTWAAVGAVAAGLLLLVLAVPRRNFKSSPPPPVEVTGSVETAANSREAASPPDRARPVLRAPTARRAAKKLGKARPECCAPHRTPPLVERRVVSGPQIEVALPTEALFPPGAAPEGFVFVADVSIGADGTIRQLELRPRTLKIANRSN